MAGLELFHVYLACLILGVGYALLIFLLGNLGGHDGGMHHGDTLGHDFGHDTGHGAGGHGDSSSDGAGQTGMSM